MTNSNLAPSPGELLQAGLWEHGRMEPGTEQHLQDGSADCQFPGNTPGL